MSGITHVMHDTPMHGKCHVSIWIGGNFGSRHPPLLLFQAALPSMMLGKRSLAPPLSWVEVPAIFVAAEEKSPPAAQEEPEATPEDTVKQNSDSEDGGSFDAQGRTPLIYDAEKKL